MRFLKYFILFSVNGFVKISKINLHFAFVDTSSGACLACGFFVVIVTKCRLVLSAGFG